VKRKPSAASADGETPLGSTAKTQRSRDELAVAATLRSPEDASLPSGTRPSLEITPELDAGTLIEGLYRLESRLGAGAMGIVMRARDERLDRPVAVKFVRPALLSASFRERFASEARAMARVNHPNVLHVYASGEHSGVPYFVMELVDGRTLEEWIESTKGEHDLGQRLAILDGICQGVAAIHEAGTVHRDIKPSNVLLDAQLHPRIADLGLAVLGGPETVTDTEVAGTPAYMAPEYASPRSVDSSLRARADVYSLACVAYELLTGKRPFSAKTSAELLSLHANAAASPPSSVRPELAPFDDVLLAALAKDPERRTPTVAAFRRALAAAQAGESEPVRILVAEDDADFRQLMYAALMREFPDAQVDCVADGKEAFASFTTKAPSAAIIDLNMPSMDGLELTSLIRASESSSAMPIIVLTGEGGPDEWRRLSAMGADRFFVKPVVLDDVVTAVRRALRERSATPRSR
jgi:eukaryotic-like serine/threonine-protein kinase